MKRCDKMLKLLIVLNILFVVHCERRFIVVPGDELCDNSTWNSAGSLQMGAICSGLSELLRVVSSNVAPEDSVIIDIEGGNEYYLDTSSYFVVPNISISINGISRSDNSRPRIMCSLNHTLETSLYALRFNLSSSVSLDRLEFIGCPRSLSFIDLLNVTITNSIFSELEDLTHSNLSATEVLANHTITSNESSVTKQPHPVQPSLLTSSMGSSSFEPIPFEQGEAYHYEPLVMETIGPSTPLVDDLSSQGYLQHIRDVPSGGGFNSSMACQRALQEAFSCLLMNSSHLTRDIHAPRDPV